MDIEFGNIETKPNGARGWIFGPFVPDPSPFKTEHFSVKWAILSKGDARTELGVDPVQRSVTVLISGKFKINFPESSTDVVLEKEGDYAYWGPGVGHTWVALEESKTVTFRWKP